MLAAHGLQAARFQHSLQQPPPCLQQPTPQSSLPSLRHPARTLSPGTDAYHAAKHWLCCAATPAAAPLAPRNTMGQVTAPADM